MREGGIGPIISICNGRRGTGTESTLRNQRRWRSLDRALLEQGGAGGGSFMEAMRAFAMCADANVEVPGYCHGAIADAKVLANQAVCQAGVNTNIGFRESAVLLRPLRLPAVTPSRA